MTEENDDRAERRAGFVLESACRPPACWRDRSASKLAAYDATDCILKTKDRGREIGRFRRRADHISFVCSRIDACFSPLIQVERKDPTMALPTQIDERLKRLGVRFAEVDERFVRGTGPGGQKINKTSSTVWLRHRPTGVEVRCQAERSQSANRELAWRELCGKLKARAQAATDAAKQEKEAQRRRTRPKTRAQKMRMIESKKHRAKHKAARGKVSSEG